MGICEACGELTEFACRTCERLFCRDCMIVHRRGMPGRH